MESHKEDTYGMFLKMESFLAAKALLLAINPAFADILNALTANDLEITQEDSTANRNLSGLTINKREKKTTLQTAVLTCASAGRGYYTTNANAFNKKLVTFSRTEIERLSDKELLGKADEVHDVVDPIKTQLAPWNVADTDVDNLLVLVNAYRPTIVERSREQDVSVVANVKMDKLFDKNDKLLNDQFDDHFAGYEFTNNELYLEGRLARAIDDSGGGSGTEGYNVQTYTIPPGGSVLAPHGPGPISPDLQIYFRSVQGDVIICTINLPASPCASGSGYNALQGVTFKDIASALNLDLSLTHIQVTNPGLTEAIVRFGVKED